MINSVSTVVALLLYYAAIAFSTPLPSQEEIAQENLRKLVIANNELSIKLLHQITANSSENILFSPFSLSTAFYKLYLGTEGNTAEELRTTLGYDTADLGEELVNQTFHQYLTQILPSRNRSFYVLNEARNAVLYKKFNYFSSYANEVRDLYQASDNIFDNLNNSTALFLFNTMHFNGAWKTAFDTNRTEIDVFFNNGALTRQKIVPMMYVRARVPAGRKCNIRAAELPYSGENVSMIILLPDEIDGLESMEKNMTREKLSAIRKKLNIKWVDMYLPKFKINYSREMSRAFKSIGAKSIFTPQADISGIASNTNAFVVQIVHKASLEVNDRGSESLAVTKIENNFMCGSSPSSGGFRVNRPFLFAIVDNRNDMILFLGRVTNI